MPKYIMRSILFVSISVGLSACSTTKINLIDGEWQLFEASGIGDATIYIWNFGPDGQFSITEFLPPDGPIQSPPSVIATAEYSTDARFAEALVRISDVSTNNSNAFRQLSMIEAASYSVNWRVLKVDDNVMRIGTDETGGFVIREFTRVQ